MAIFLFTKIALFFKGEESKPESLIRVQKLTGKSLTFYKGDLCKIDNLREIFSKVYQLLDNSIFSFKKSYNFIASN